MAYVIATGCCSDASCIPVCPVDCIRPKPGDPQFLTAEQLYIDPASCIDCAACMWECPVGAIHDEYDLPDGLDVFREINAEYFQVHPLEVTEPERRAKRRLPEDRPVLRVAVVGSGPSGCYVTDELSAVAGVEVSVFDRLPTPYGLVRAGVAPDHQDTKKVTSQFHQVLRRPNVTCYFNVEVGRDVTVAELLEHHHAVVVAVGAADDRTLGIPGEDLPGSFSAREFVAWYNGHPDQAGRSFDLSGERAVVIGNGNVALDVARVLAAPAQQFESTDMAAHAVRALRDSGIREVVVAARRGVLDAAYTTAEFLALTALDGVDVTALPEEVRLTVDSGPEPPRYGAGRRRELAVAASERRPDPARRRITFRYLLTPVAIEGSDAVEAVRFRRTGGTGEETIETGLVLRAVGYQAAPLPGVPFDEATGTIPNAAGRVVTADGAEPVPGLYCAGWAKRGATGVIGTNKVCSAETVESLFADFAAGRLAEPSGDGIGALVSARQPAVVGFEQWLKIDAAEIAQGSGRPREKFHHVADMLAVAHG